MKLGPVVGSAVVAAWLAAAPAPAAESSKDVRVVNAPGESVPVTGTVALAPGAQVGVANTAEAPLHVAPARPQVFMRSVHFSADSGELFTYLDMPVPAGKRLVVEAVSAAMESVEEQRPRFVVSAAVDGSAVGFTFAAEHSLETGASIYEHVYHVSRSLRLYHDGDEPNHLRLSVLRESSNGRSSGNFSVVGYLTDVP